MQELSAFETMAIERIAAKNKLIPISAAEWFPDYPGTGFSGVLVEAGSADLAPEIVLIKVAFGGMIGANKQLREAMADRFLADAAKMVVAKPKIGRVHRRILVVREPGVVTAFMRGTNRHVIEGLGIEVQAAELSSNELAAVHDILVRHAKMFPNRAA